MLYDNNVYYCRSDNYQSLMDTFMSAISYVSALENKIDILKIHTFYPMCFI